MYIYTKNWSINSPALQKSPILRFCGCPRLLHQVFVLHVLLTGSMDGKCWWSMESWPDTAFLFYRTDPYSKTTWDKCCESFFCIPAIHQNKAPMIRLPEILNLFNCKILAAGHPKKLETQNNAWLVVAVVERRISKLLVNAYQCDHHRRYIG